MTIGIGQRFGRWTVLGPGPSVIRKERSPRPTWVCRCACCNERVVLAQSLLNGCSKSCGCLSREIAAITSARTKLRHGHSRISGESRTYTSWQAMRRRCLNPRSTQYAYYGGRGVSICQRWETFENFLADMGERPNGRSLDRINPYGNYEPSNCRWATSFEQTHNRRQTT